RYARQVVGRRKRGLGRIVAIELVLAPAERSIGNVPKCPCEDARVAADRLRHVVHACVALDGAGIHRFDVAMQRDGDGLAALVPDRPGYATGLAQNAQRLFRIALVLVGEAAAVLVDLYATFGNARPGYVDVVRSSDRTMSLERAHVLDRGAERLAPEHRFALVADVAVIVRVRDLGNVALEQSLVAAVPVEGEDQRLAANVLDALV